MKIPTVTLAILVFGVFGLAVTNAYLLRTSSLASVISAVLVDLTNGDRSADKLGGLSVSPVLTAAAQAKADDMATKGYFAHTSPDGKSSWYWFREAGYTFLYAGENLAVDFSDSTDVEKAWMNSPLHRANILDSHFTQIGIATAQGMFEGRPTTFVVQMFGTPSATTAAVSVVAAPSEPTAPAVATTKPVTAVVAPKPLVNVAPQAAPVAAVARAAARQVLGAEADSILPPAPATWWQHLLASPKLLLECAYYTLAGILLVILAYVTELEFHKRQLRHVAATLFLFVLMSGLFMLADVVLFGAPVIAAL